MNSPIDAVKLTQDFIRCPSITPKEAGSLDILEKYLSALGFKIWRKTFQEKGYEDVENLYARIGEGSPHLCLAGHLDVVPTGDEKLWSHPPFAAHIDNGHLFGRGAADMKSGVACLVSAAQEFLTADFKGSLSFLITMDEEGPAVNGIPKMLGWMKEQGETPDACLLAEPSCPDIFGEAYKIGRRGTLSAHLTVKGVQGHVAYPDKADNPITRLVKILDALKAHKLDNGHENFPPSNLEVTRIYTDNKAENVIAASAEAGFNIRYNTHHSAESLQQWITDIVKSYTHDYALIFKPNGDPFLAPSDSLLAQAIENGVEKVMGQKPKAETTGGTSDGRFIKDICPVAEFGIVGATNHKIDENVKIEDIYKLHQCYVEIFKQFFA